MDEYIKRQDALKIIDNYSTTVTKDGKVVADAIRDIIAVITPTSDVAPKSEVERLTVELEAMRCAANFYKMHYVNAKAEQSKSFWQRFLKRKTPQAITRRARKW